MPDENKRSAITHIMIHKVNIIIVKNTLKHPGMNFESKHRNTEVCQNNYWKTLNVKIINYLLLNASQYWHELDVECFTQNLE